MCIFEIYGLTVFYNIRTAKLKKVLSLLVHYCFNMDSFNSIEYSFDLIKSIQSDIESAYTDLFELAKKINQISDEYKTQSPYHINIIDELYINENAHSRILAKLLQFQGPSGAYEILESFIEFIKRKKKSNEFDQIEVNYPIISQEEERIDLWICDYEANCALIFENKIYGATDQRSQLNRYIRKTKDRKFADENIFVFYLTKYGNEPSAQTWGNEETRLKYENRYMALSYRDDILHWLKDFVVPNIRFKDIYLQCATNQYIDYLEGLFSLRHINKSFNMKIQKIISDRLRLETYNEEGAVKKIEETIENLDETRNHLVQLLSKARRNLWSKYLKDLSKIAEKVAEKYKLVCSIIRKTICSPNLKRNDCDLRLQNQNETDKIYSKNKNETVFTSTNTQSKTTHKRASKIKLRGSFRCLYFQVRH